MEDSSAPHTVDLQAKIDLLDNSLDQIRQTDGTFRRSLRTLRELCGESGLVPTRYRLSGLARIGTDPPCAGGFADVYRGTYNGTAVALKFMRLHVRDGKSFMKVFCREAVVWKRLNHPHIVPFIGIDPSYQACIVSEWMEHGDVMSYLENYPRANRVELITDVARGLEYMHASGLVHGDLKSRNVLVDSLGYARLSDFGLATTVLGTATLAPTAGSSANWGSFRYMAPELSDIEEKGKTLTWKSDVYAFGMTAWEIFAERHPFYNIPHELVVLLKVRDGKRPERPLHARALGLDDFIWSNVISSCWVARPSERPRILEVLNRLQWYKTARRLIAKLLDEGLAEVDRQVLDEMLSTEMGRAAIFSNAGSSTLSESLETMLGESTETNLRETRAIDMILVLGTMSSFLPDMNLKQYPGRVMDKLGPHVDKRRQGIQQAMARMTQKFNRRGGLALQRTMRGHTNEVFSVSFSPDGSQIASGSGDKIIRIWNAHTGKEIREPLRGHTSDVSSVSFSPDGKRLASASGDETVRLWDVETGQQVGQPLEGHTHWVSCVAFSPDGDRIVSGSYDYTLRLWDAHTGQAIGEPLRGHSGEVNSVAVSPDGKNVASGSDDSTIRLWDAKTGQPVGDPLRGHDRWVLSVAYSPDGARIVSGSVDNTIRIWDAQTRQTVLGPLQGQGHKYVVTSVAFSPDGQYIVSGSDDRTIRIWDAQTGQTVAGPWQAHGRSFGVSSVAFSPDGKHLVSGSSDGLVKIWDGEVD